SIPSLKNTIILGNGPDTFPFVFPQGELIAKYYALDTPNITVDKAHNLYLQMALNYGVIALLAFLIITITYLVDSFKLYAFKENYDLDKQKMLGAITSLGVLGYLVTGFFNDSVVSVAPVFWIVFGVGVALNFMNRETLRKLSK
ncbi:O-antigen ligase family protein, partial [Clostridium beijerinckii]